MPILFFETPVVTVDFDPHGYEPVIWTSRSISASGFLPPYTDFDTPFETHRERQPLNILRILQRLSVCMLAAKNYMVGTAIEVIFQPYTCVSIYRRFMKNYSQAFSSIIVIYPQ
jgi:hypothetical protein